MRKRDKIRKIIVILITLTLLCAIQATNAEDGILPSLTEAYGISMPSPGEALQIYPDSETKNEDGSVTYLYSIATEDDYNTFSVYLKQKGAELADYRLEDGVMEATIRVNNVSFSFAYDTGNYEMKVTYPEGTSDVWVKNAKKHFSYAQKLLELGRTEEAFTEIYMIPQYMDYAPVKELAKSNKDFEETIAAHKERLESFKQVGSLVTFGKYEQDNDLGNGPEGIQWIVLDYDAANQRALLISKYGLDAIPFNNEYTAVTWENCSLRSWLNNSFLSGAFNVEEQNAILMTEVDNGPASSEAGAKNGNNTMDHIYLLSYTEAGHYFGVCYEENQKACVTPTPYAIAQGAFESDSMMAADGKPAGRWWLRSNQRDFPDSASVVQEDGTYSGDGVSYEPIIVRPTLWVDINANFF